MNIYLYTCIHKSKYNNHIHIYIIWPNIPYKCTYVYISNLYNMHHILNGQLTLFSNR
ncbi:hypothetical protein F383_11274 [Gossypium arboreum]|uniref:Uncharacterized protein n=1 Tax=Gossypium arboreum TaxID=29729 RepID=A0A0B0ND46_GOSAR|nr:hypothetical protein F383_11274 [Gossypium arboreum]